MKLAEIVRETQHAEEEFDRLAGEKLEDMAAHPNPATDESDLQMMQIFAHNIVAMGKNTDEIIRMWPQYEK